MTSFLYRMVKAFGINNLGNTCFFNAIFQLLLCCDKFIDYTLKYGNHGLIKLLIKNIDNFNYDIYKQIITLCRGRFGSQEDSDEYFLIIINKMSEQIQNLFKVKTKIEYHCKWCGFNSVAEQENFQVFVYTEFKMSYSYKEKCNNCTNNWITTVTIINRPDYLYLVLNPSLEIKLPTEIENYKLVGYAIYTGNHYYSVGEREGQIFTFNDSSISPAEFDGSTKRKRLAIFKKL